MTTLRGLAGRSLARLDALTEELANLCTELAAEKQRQSANRRWAIGAIIAGTLLSRPSSPPWRPSSFDLHWAGKQRTCTTPSLEGLIFLTWADIKEYRTDPPGQDANWVSDRTLPSGSANHATLSPPGVVQTPFSSCSMPS